ncbi:hypothetical protein DLY76_06375 [Staphylococcus warneri]|uniref:hypothetical protein n=1 Tax=Staphylococcus warneri TaxID=1292 RepID=UPI000D9A2053|nr:hypothetical protein [Staphylococcus warneri]PXX85652.1 hypothetical protein DLY76_06375 [Staphylococcus warneri]
METQKLTEHRLNALEQQIKSHDEKIDDLLKDIQQSQRVHDERYRELSNTNTRLDEGHKAQQEKVNEVMKSLGTLISKIDLLSDDYRNHSLQLERRFSEIQTKVKNQSESATEMSDIEDTKPLNKLTKGSITVGIFGIIEVFVQYVAPLLFK